jgi:ERCC4-type nuclease
VGEGGLEEVEEQEGEESDFKKYLPNEFLKRLPGVDSHNINKIIKNVKTIVDLSKMPEDELKDILGARNAKDLRTFLDKKVELVKDESGE